MQTVIPPPPDKSPIAVQGSLGISGDYYRWFTEEIVRRLQRCAQVIKALSLTAQSAAIVTTALVSAPAATIYRVSGYLRVTQAASVSSSATLTISWTDGGVAQSVSFAALTGNTTATNQPTDLACFHADAGTNISYAVAYASVGGTVMQFRLDLIAEQMN